MLKLRQHLVGACADMGITCPPGIPKKLCLERSLLLQRLMAMEKPAPPQDRSPPPTIVDSIVGISNPEPPGITPTNDIFIESGPAKWSRGSDVRAISGPTFVFGPEPADDGLTSVLDLMGMGNPTHTGPLPIF